MSLLYVEWSLIIGFTLQLRFAWGSKYQTIAFGAYCVRRDVWLIHCTRNATNQIYDLVDSVRFFSLILFFPLSLCLSILRSVEWNRWAKCNLFMYTKCSHDTWLMLLLDWNGNSARIKRSLFDVAFWHEPYECSYNSGFWIHYPEWSKQASSRLITSELLQWNND